MNQQWYTAPWPYWSVTAVVAASALWLIWVGLWRDRSRGRARCPKCWYDLSGAPGPPDTPDSSGAPNFALPITCPECGRVVRSKRALHRTRRRWRWALLGAIVLSLAWYGREVRYRVITLNEPLTKAAIPNTALIVAVRGGDFKQVLELWHRAERKTLFPLMWGKQAPSHLYRWQQRLLVGSLGHAVRTCGNQGTVEFAIGWLYILAEPHPSAVDAIIPGLERSTMPDARTSACSALGELHAVKAAGQLIARVGDTDLNVQRHAVSALGKIGRGQFDGMSDARLCDLLQRILPLSDDDGATPSVYLSEMIRRRGPTITRRLQALVESEQARTFGFELLTALRRVQGKPDPIHVQVMSSAQLQGTPDDLPGGIKVQLVNVEVEKRYIQLDTYGFDGDPRHSNWRFDVRDGAGRPLPIRQRWGLIKEIGFVDALGPGDTACRTDLDMNQFFAHTADEAHDDHGGAPNWTGPIPPGQYTVVIQFHDRIDLANVLDATDLITAVSAPIPMTIRPPQPP